VEVDPAVEIGPEVVVGQVVPPDEGVAVGRVVILDQMMAVYHIADQVEVNCFQVVLVVLRVTRDVARLMSEFQRATDRLREPLRRESD